MPAALRVRGDDESSESGELVGTSIPGRCLSWGGTPLTPEPTPSNGLRVFFASAAVFWVTAAFYVTKTARDALYIQRDGLHSVSLSFVFVAILSIPQARLVLKSVGRFGPRRTRVGMQLLGAVGLALYFPFATPGPGVVNDLFFVAVPLAFSVLFSMTWLLTSDLMEGGEQADVAAAFARVAAASMAGGTIGAAAAGPLAGTIGPRGLILAGAGLLVVAAAVTLLAQGTFAATREVSAAGGVRQAPPVMGEVLQSRYVRLLVAIAVAGAFAAVMIEFQFYLGAALSHRGDNESASYFASIYFIVNAGALVIQLLFGARLQRYVGLAGALMVLPLVVLGGGTALMFGGVVVLGAGLRVAEGGLRSSIHRSNWEQAFVGVEHRARPMVKVLVDGLSARLAAGLAALTIYLWLAFVVADGDLSTHDTTWISVCIVASTVGWVVATARLRRMMKECVVERYPFMPAPLADSCPTTATLGGGVYSRGH